MSWTPPVLQPFQQLVILGVWTDPEPIHMIAFAQTEGTIAEANPHRVNRLALADPLELQTVMVGLGTPEGIRASRLLLGGPGELQQQLPKGFGDT